MTSCSVEDCDRPTTARGWCGRHYAQLRPRSECTRDGCTRPIKGRGICAAHAEEERRRNIGPPKHVFGERGPCTAPGCGRLVWTPGRQHCQMHYQRLWRNGTLEVKLVRGERGPCAVSGCESRVVTPGKPYCELHQQRHDKHGDPRVNGRFGERSPHWKGDAAGYQAAHRRVHVRRGKAATLACVDCAAPAAHWSYDHTDPSEIASEVGPYSLDVDRYDPRCTSCHTRFDKGLSRRAGSPEQTAG